MKDPVCKMEVDESSGIVSEYKGKRYVFCSKACKETFDRNPDKYAK